MFEGEVPIDRLFKNITAFSVVGNPVFKMMKVMGSSLQNLEMKETIKVALGERFPKDNICPHRKVLKLQERGGDRSFQAECEALKNIRHRNLIKIIKSCSSTDFKHNVFNRALVFELMENGSLDNWLYPRSVHEQQQTTSLNLIQRLNIAVDVTSALDYRHYHCEVAIIHRN
ncbi:hypothetical protein RHMOL_Rhmol05G0210400 [Rhododendron molle]|uniref:Uncharacterized protein n=1 Tax=Rhododendron molle TaxID=49168 RepID=A0ACC0NTH7_RHOML|nr:hypothetical protein RHMOL_Rhmol05G0210400 [Rhododendron molle]